MTEFIQYIISARSEILSLFLEHIQLTTLALAAAILIGVPLGILISYLKPASKPVPVSYTHLDVYKRQVRINAHKAEYPVSRGRQKKHQWSKDLRYEAESPGHAKSGLL